MMFLIIVVIVQIDITCTEIRHNWVMRPFRKLIEGGPFASSEVSS
jgi:hypothetical protein